ncbi:MAG: hypothetical protein ACPK85_06010 [Methanosarcina sp.]
MDRSSFIGLLVCVFLLLFVVNFETFYSTLSLTYNSIMPELGTFYAMIP